MIKVGLTGGIGSGKTTIAYFFETLRIPIYYSDFEARRLMVENRTIKKNLVDLLGSDVYLKNGELNKPYISNQIFNNNSILKQVNSIVHPVVKEHFNIFCKAYQNSKYIIKESAILIESGLHKDLDKIILVIANEENKLRRVADRDNINFEDVKARISKQMTDKEKIPFSDFVITNNNNQLLIPELIKIHEVLNR